MGREKSRLRSNCDRTARDDLRSPRAAKAATPEDFQREIIDFEFRVSGRPAVPGFHYGDRPVALLIYNHSHEKHMLVADWFAKALI